jgi:hypothetical protein
MIEGKFKCPDCGGDELLLEELVQHGVRLAIIEGVIDTFDLVGTQYLSSIYRCGNYQCRWEFEGPLDDLYGEAIFEGGKYD